MKKLTEEKLNSNYVIFTKKLEKYNCYSEDMLNDLGMLIKNGTYGMSEESGTGYKGSLVDVILNKLCRIAFEINSCVFSKHQTLIVDENKLIRVLLLLHLSKAIMFTPTKESWKEKKGVYYDFSEMDTSLKLGERSIFLCQKYGIHLDEDEFEAMCVVDKKDSVESKLIFSTPLTNLVYVANILTDYELKKENIKHD